MTTGVRVRAGLFVFLLIAGAVVALTADLPGVAAVRSWLSGAGASGWLLLTLAVGLALLAPVPRTALSVLLGVVAGFPAGLAVALTGGLLGGLLGFGLSRCLGRAAVARIAGDRLAQVDRLAGERGFAAVLAARLLPVLPFTVVSYGAGLTGIRLLPYAAATALGLLPSTVVQVGLGASAPWITTWAVPLTSANWPLAAVAAVAAAGAACCWWRGARPVGSVRPVVPVRKDAVPQTEREAA